jgi:hypothetical protein
MAGYGFTEDDVLYTFAAVEKGHYGIVQDFPTTIRKRSTARQTADLPC